MRASWRAWSRAGQWDANAGRHVAASRSQIIEALASDGVLWPLVDEGPSCARCASPRQKMAAGDAAECRGCRMLAKAYASPLADVHPITYTAPRWRLCVGVRVLKDVLAARSDSVLARNIGAILSAYLEHHLGGRRLGLSHGFGVVTTVPSSRPVIAGALRRATLEGWWSTELTVVATARRGACTSTPAPGRGADARARQVGGRPGGGRRPGRAGHRRHLHQRRDRAQLRRCAPRRRRAQRPRGGAGPQRRRARTPRGCSRCCAAITTGGWRWTPSVGAYDVLARDRPAVVSATCEAVSRCDGGTRDRARSAAREARTRSCPPCRPRS